MGSGHKSQWVDYTKTRDSTSSTQHYNTR